MAEQQQSFRTQQEAEQAADIERRGIIPGLPGATAPNAAPPMTSGMGNPMAQGMAAHYIQQMQGSGTTLPFSSGTSSVVGGPPPAMTPHALPSGASIPGLTMMGPAQAGGPVARTSPYQNPGGMQFRSPRARDAVVVGNTIQSLSQFVTETKQRNFEKEAAQANQLVSQIINSKQMQAKAKSGEPLTMQDIKMAAGDPTMTQDPKQHKMLMKILDKAQSDPMSAAYVGIQRAYQTEQAKADKALADEEIRSKIQMQYAEAYRRQTAGYGNVGAGALYRATLGAATKVQEVMGSDGKRHKVSFDPTTMDWSVDVGISPPSPTEVKVAEGKTESQNKSIEKGLAEGRIVTFDKDGKEHSRYFTAQQIAESPTLSEKKKLIDSQVAKNYAAVKESAVKAETARLVAQYKASGANIDPKTAERWARWIADPKTGYTIANVPTKERSAVNEAMSRMGLEPSKPMTAAELNRSDLANNAIHNIKHAMRIVNEHGEIFGPGGWLHNQFEMAGSGGDKNAVEFLASVDLGDIAALGVHGLRAKAALDRLTNANSNTYKNIDSVKADLKVLQSSLEQVVPGGGRTMPLIPKEDVSGGGVKPPQGTSSQGSSSGSGWEEKAKRLGLRPVPQQ